MAISYVLVFVTEVKPCWPGSLLGWVTASVTRCCWLFLVFFFRFHSCTLKPGFHMIATIAVIVVLRSLRSSRSLKLDGFQMIAAIARKSRVGMGPRNKPSANLTPTLERWQPQIKDVFFRRATFLFLILAVLKRRRQRGREEKGKHRFWVRSIFQKREELEAFHTLAQELRLDDRECLYRWAKC